MRGVERRGGVKSNGILENGHRTKGKPDLGSSGSAIAAAQEGGNDLDQVLMNPVLAGFP